MGWIHILEWARKDAEPPCEWDERTTRAAVKNEHYDIVRWACQKADPPCPMDDATRELMEGHWEELEDDDDDDDDGSINSENGYYCEECDMYHRNDYSDSSSDLSDDDGY